MPIIQELRRKNLINEAVEGRIEVIAQGNNCFCTQKKGLALEMSQFFNTTDFPMEAKGTAGDVNKLGCIDFKLRATNIEEKKVWVVNMYTQYHWATPSPYGIPLDYDALRLCFRKLNMEFKAKSIGIPGLIGCGLAKGNEDIVKDIINQETTKCNIIIYYTT
jgi:hypothetical protein